MSDLSDMDDIVLAIRNQAAILSGEARSLMPPLEIEIHKDCAAHTDDSHLDYMPRCRCEELWLEQIAAQEEQMWKERIDK